jgi:hypothetical protein
LENSKKHISLKELSFPVFKLSAKAAPEEQDGILYYVSENFNRDTAEYRQQARVLDDTTMPGPTLAHRRLQAQKLGATLYPIRAAIYFLGDFIKLAKPNTWFIDSTGRVFQYQKTTRAKLEFYPVQNLFPLPGMGAVVEVRGIPQRFKVLYMPTDIVRWAGIVQFGKMLILYGLYKDRLPDTWRMI